jgi:photosystem II stability/assembly factor-like uncharacterized protein
MKKSTLFKLILIAAFLPVLVTGQWSMVRWDQHNFFNHSFTATSNTAFFSGMELTSSGSFIMRSNDGGLTWDSILINNNNMHYQLNTIEFTNALDGFAGGLNNVSQALIKTVDNGNSWTDITPDPSSTEQIKAVSFYDALHGFAADRINIYSTNDAGLTWNTHNAGISVEDIRFSDGNTGYACGILNTDAVVIKTTDGGQTWNNVLMPLQSVTFGSAMKKIDFGQDAVFASVWYLNSMFRSIDDGVNWSMITVPGIYEIKDFDFINADEGYVLSSMGEIYYTNDGGQTWTLQYAVAAGAYGPSVYLTSISFSGNTGYVCGSNGLIKKFTPAVTSITADNKSAISFYPNPFNGSRIKIDGNTRQIQLRIINNVGAIIFTGTIDNGENEIVFDRKLPGGIYTVFFNDNENVSAQKLVVAE